MVERIARIAAQKSQGRLLNEADPVDPTLQHPEASPEVRRIGTAFLAARAALLNGDNEEATALFERLLVDLAETELEVPASIFTRVRTMVALSHLRLGEQENCLEEHNPQACLLPIRAGGVHRHQRGSRAALEELSSMLEENPDDLAAIWLYNIAAMTLGLYPREVPEAWRVPPSMFESQHDLGRFPDIAPALGLDVVDQAGGSVVEDLDGDGNLDVLVSSWGVADPLRCFRNRGDGTFEELDAGLAGLTGGLNLVQADYDNDGFVDVLVLRGAWLGLRGHHPNSLLRNRGDGTFEDATEAAGVLSFHPTQTAAWADVDGDGWLDLFIGNESLQSDPHPSELYMNRGDGTFVDVATAAGIAQLGYVKGAAWGDYDNDGRPDLYVSRAFKPNLLFHNESPQPNGLPKFRPTTTAAGVAEPVYSFPTWFWDFDNDGWLDLFVSGYVEDFSRVVDPVVAEYLGRPTDGETPRLYRNRGDGTFEDVTAAAGLDQVLLTMGTNFGDLDNDGSPDLYLATGAPDFAAIVPNRMFWNDGEGRFLDVSASGGFSHLQKGHGVSFADIDNDGDQDVHTVIGGAYTGDIYANALFHNPGHGNRWITLRLEGVTANRSAIGARIEIEIDSPSRVRRIFHTVGSGGSFGANSLQAEIGLGDARRLRRLRVDWPGSGTVEEFVDVEMDRYYRLLEGSEQLEPITQQRIELAPTHSSTAG